MPWRRTHRRSGTRLQEMDPIACLHLDIAAAYRGSGQCAFVGPSDLDRMGLLRLRLLPPGICVSSVGEPDWLELYGRAAALSGPVLPGAVGGVVPAVQRCGVVGSAQPGGERRLCASDSAQCAKSPPHK